MNFLKKSIFNQSLYKQKYLTNYIHKDSFNFVVKKNFYFNQAKHGAGDVSLNKYIKLIFLFNVFYLATYCR